MPGQAATISQTSGLPKAYLFYILFDNNYVYQQFGYQAITSAALIGHERLYLDFTIPSSGYLYTYVTNESNVSTATSVYFDDFNIIHTRATSVLQVVQTTDYYPFGLGINPLSYQKQSALDNDYLYNGKELQDDHNLGWRDYGARMYMTDIGRWGVVDPLAEHFYDLSAYHYAYNDPVKHIDPDGRSGEVSVNNRKKTVTVRARITMYGDGASRGLAKSTARNVQNSWNKANAKVTINGKEYTVKFKVTGSFSKNMSSERVQSKFKFQE